MIKPKKILATALIFLLALSSLTVCAYNRKINDDTTVVTSAVSETTQQSETTVPEVKGKILMENSIGKYTLIRSEDASATAVKAAVAFNKAVTELTGKALTIKEDYVKNLSEIDANAPEVLIGETNRPESAELFSTLEKYQFAIKITDTKIVISAWSDIILCDAVDYFVENYLKSDRSTVSEGNLVLLSDESYISDGSGYGFKSILRMHPEFDSICTSLFTVPKLSSTIKTPQGGYTDGTYFYQAFLFKDTSTNEAGNVVKIVKTELATGKILKISDDLATNHSNDITYNSKLNCLVVAHNNPNRTLVSLIDADTLKLVRTVTLPCSIYSIDYNETYDKYVVGISGGQDFRFLNADFALDGNIHPATDITTGYVTQGVSCDDNFIYFVLYKNNVITVYDWDGNYVTLIKLNVGSIEPENISVVDDNIYVTCISNGAAVFRVTPIITEDK